MIGLDIGLTQDPSAYVVLARRPGKDGRKSQYLLREATRLPLGTPYNHLATIIEEKSREFSPALIVVDTQNAGSAVLDCALRPALGQMKSKHLIPIKATSGNTVTHTDGTFHVPTQDLAQATALIMEEGRLFVPESAKGGMLLLDEMRHFRIIPLKTGGRYEAASGKTDDLVMALLMALWASDVKGFAPSNPGERPWTGRPELYPDNDPFPCFDELPDRWIFG